MVTAFPRRHARLLSSSALIPLSLVLLPLAWAAQAQVAQAPIAPTQPAQPQPAQAQTTDSLDAPTLLPTVDVTTRRQTATDRLEGYVATRELGGTKTDTPIIEVPQSISVITRDQIDQRQAQTLGEALRYTAGVRPEQFGSDSRADWIQIRGFEATETSQFLNGLRYNPGFAAGTFETWGLERYEIVRGPSSVLYGQIAPGGLINLVQRRPTDNPTGEVRLSAGTNDTAQAAFTASGPLTADKTWSYSLTGLGRLGDLDYSSSRNDRLFFAPALTWRPDADTRVTLLPYYQRDRTTGAQFLPFLGTAQRTEFGRISRNLNTGERGFDKYDRTQYGVGYEIERRLNDVFTLSQNARYSHIDVNWRQVYGGGLVTGSEREINRFAYSEDYSYDTFQVDSRAQARFRTGPLDHTLLAGVDYQHISNKSVAAFALASPLDVYAPTYGSAIPDLSTPYQNRVQGIDQVGLYGQDQIKLGERWVATLGIRHDWVDQDLKNRAFGFTSTNQDNSATTYRAGIAYLAPMGLTPYFSYSTSFLPQAGTFSPARGSNGFEPTRGRQFEVGLKYQPTGLNSFVQVSAFHIRQNNVLTTDPDNSLFQVQTGQIRVRGAEFEAVASLTDGLSLIGSMTYLDPEITRDNAGNQGNRPVGVPKFSAGAYADYTFATRTDALRGLGLGAGVRFVGNTASSNANTNVVPSVTLFDLSGRYDLGALGRNLDGFNLLLNVSNVGDKRYVARCSSDAACFYGNGRLILGSLSYRW